jgi:hypothetical protein
VPTLGEQAVYERFTVVANGEEIGGIENVAAEHKAILGELLLLVRIKPHRSAH